jgi:hypothetical protein
MSNSTVQYVKVPLKIGTPGSAGTLSNSKDASNNRSISNTRYEKCKEGRLTTPGMPAISGSPAQVRTSGTKDMPGKAGCQQ